MQMFVLFIARKYTTYRALQYLRARSGIPWYSSVASTFRRRMRHLSPLTENLSVKYGVDNEITTLCFNVVSYKHLPSETFH